MQNIAGRPISACPWFQVCPHPPIAHFRYLFLFHFFPFELQTHNFLSVRFTWMPYKPFSHGQKHHHPPVCQSHQAGSNSWVLLSLLSHTFLPLFLTVNEGPLCPSLLPLPFPFSVPLSTSVPSWMTLFFHWLLSVTPVFYLYSVVSVVFWHVTRIILLRPKNFVYSLFRAIFDSASFPATLSPVFLTQHTMDFISPMYLVHSRLHSTQVVFGCFLLSAPHQKQKRPSKANLIAEKTLFFKGQTLTP